MCGRTLGMRGRERETQWWNDAFTKTKLHITCGSAPYFHLTNTVTKIVKKELRKKVVKAKEPASRKWSENPDTENGWQNMFGVVKQIRKDQKNVNGLTISETLTEGNIKIGSADDVERWKAYFKVIQMKKTRTTSKKSQQSKNCWSVLHIMKLKWHCA